MIKKFWNRYSYEIVCKSEGEIVEFLELSDKQSRRKRDFIVFADKNGNETVRNLLEIVDHKISYISMNGSGIEDVGKCDAFEESYLQWKSRVIFFFDYGTRCWYNADLY